MQARLELRRFPTRPLAIAVAMTAALAGSGALGYALRTPTLVSGPTRVVQVTGDPAFGPNDCIVFDHHKSC